MSGWVLGAGYDASGWMTGLGRARILGELDHDTLMDCLRVYSREPRSREEASVCDQIAWEFHLRQSPTGERRGPGFDANGRDVGNVIAQYTIVSREEAGELGLLGDCVQSVGGWDCHLRAGVRWSS